MIGLNGKEPAEASNSLGIKVFSSVGPFKGMSEELIPGFDEGNDCGAQLLNSEKVIVFEALPFENSKPYEPLAKLYREKRMSPVPRGLLWKFERLNRSSVYKSMILSAFVHSRDIPLHLIGIFHPVL